MKIIFMTNILMNLQKSIGLKTNIWMKSFRFMQIYCRFLESGKPSGQEILNWFSYLVSIYKGCDMDEQTISHSQDSDLTMKYRGYTLSNLHSNTVVGESLSEILDPLAPKCEPFNDPPPKNHEHN